MTVHTLLQLVTEDLGAAVKETRDYHRWPCPFVAHEHDDRNPAFDVYEHDGGLFYKCQKCGEKGDDVSWLVNHRKMTQSAAMRLQRGNGGMYAPAARPKPAKQPQKRIEPPDSEWQYYADAAVIRCAQLLQDGYQGSGAAVGAAKWLTQRGIGQLTASKFGLGFNPEGKKLRNEEWLPAGLTIPCYEGVNLWYVKVRQTKTEHERTGQKYKCLTSSKANALFNTDSILSENISRLVIVEGEFDAILAHTFSPPDTAVLTKGSVNQFPEVEYWFKYLAGFMVVHIYQDNDAAGQVSLDGWLKAVPHGQSMPPLPAGDVTDYWMDGGNVYQWIAEGVAT